MRSKNKFILFAIAALSLISVMAQAAPFNAVGDVFTPAGTTGSAADSPSFANLAIYRYNIQAQVGAHHPVEKIFDATGSDPAFFATDLQPEWSTAAATGQTATALVESRKGKLGWIGPAAVYYQLKVISAAEFGSSSMIFSDGQQREFPQAVFTDATLPNLTLQWSALPDPQGIIESYSVYRSTAPPDPSDDRLPDANALTALAYESGGIVTFVDPVGCCAAEYYYTYAPNFTWSGVAMGNGGARPLEAYYTTFGQSPAAYYTTGGTQTPSPLATVTATVTATATASPTHTSTATVGASHTPTVTASATPTETSTPLSVFTQTPTWGWRNSGLGKIVVAPNPVKAGGKAWIYFDLSPVSVVMKIYNSGGELVAEGSFGQSPQIGWLLPATTAAGIYHVKLKIDTAAGVINTWRKIMVVR